MSLPFKMMFRNSSSSLLSHRRCLSDPNMVRHLRSSIGNSNKSMDKFLGCGYSSKTRFIVQGMDEEEEPSCILKTALSETNLNMMLHPITTEETNQSLGKRESSAKDELNAGDELDKPIMEAEEGSGKGNGGGIIAGGGERGYPWESFGADSNSTDVYYQQILEANPRNPLLLSNYAKFLHQVRCDVEKAEEYYKRALLASPGDGEILALYARFIWKIHSDEAQAEEYFKRAVEVAPDDCYVAAAYANFLWNNEEDENSLSVTTQTHYSSVTAVGA